MKILGVLDDSPVSIEPNNLLYIFSDFITPFIVFIACFPDGPQVEERSRAKALVRRDSEVIDVEGTSTGSLTRSASCRMDKPLFWRVDLPEARSELVGWRKLWELIGVKGDGSKNGFVCC